MPPRAAKTEIEGLVLLLDVGVSMSTKIGNTSTTYLQACVDIIQMIAQRKMFETSKDELSLILYGTRETANELWDGSSDHYRHVNVARPLSIVDWKLLEYMQNNISATNLQGDSLDGLIVASNHFHEDMNVTKCFKDKRIMILTDFSSSADDEDEKIEKIKRGLADHSIRVDVISPFKEEDDDDEKNKHNNKEKNKSSSNSNGTASNCVDNNDDEVKTMTNEQKANCRVLRRICEKTEGAMYSFDEVLTVLCNYKPKMVKSSGTKYQWTIGDSFSLPIVSLINTKENKPDIFRQKKLYAKDETETKTDRARFTKDDEQRDLPEKDDVIDAYKYGSTYVPIDHPDTLRLEVTKCFSLIGFTKTENIKRHYFLGEATNEILPDPSAGGEVEEAFVNMVRSMYLQDVYGIVRRVFSTRSSPELGCLIPCIRNKTLHLYYIQLPFEDDIKSFTLDNFTLNKKFAPTSTQLELVDNLIDSMDLTKPSTSGKSEQNHEEEEEEEPELYDPHTTINPYIQRMFQSIAHRATNPNQDLPNFETHITSTHLSKIGERVRRNKTTVEALKRCSEEFKLKETEAKKNKINPEESLFEAKKKETNGDDEIKKEIENVSLSTNQNLNLNELLQSTSLQNSKVKKVGTITPVADFKLLAERILSNQALKPTEDIDNNDFEELCLQIQTLVQEFLNESLRHCSDNDSENENEMTVLSFQEKSFECIKVMREYSVKLKLADSFNRYLKAFKLFLINQTHNKKLASHVEKFWTKFFAADSSVTFITHKECSESDMGEEEAKEFSKSFQVSKEEANVNSANLKEDEEDLLDLM